MIRKYALSIAGAVLLTGFVALLFNSNALAQNPQPKSALAPAVDVGPSFTYQGYLQQGGVAVTGSCDFEFRLFNAVTAGTQIGTTQPKNGQAISQGRFTVDLNFGASAIDGQARWLQIAVRCPAGSGAFTTLAPRQVLTATPYALSLRPGAVVAGNVSSAGILNLTNNGTSSGDIGLKVVSAPVGVQVDSASMIGVYVGTVGGAGVYVDSAGNNGVQVNSAVNGFYVQSAGYDGVYVDSADNSGVHVKSAGNGLQVDTAVQDGLFICATGSSTTCTPDDARHNGVEIGDAEQMGVYIQNAGSFGVGVYSSADDGVSVYSAGNPSSHNSSLTKDGFEVAGAEGFGLYIGRADQDGVRIRSTGDDGIQIGDGSIAPAFGLYVPSPGTANTTLWPETANAIGEWALFTSDKISAANVTISDQTLVAVAAGDLAAGDAVSAIGLADPLPNSLSHLAQVRVADGTSGVAGVVESRMELQPAPGKEGVMILHSVAGPAKAGDYVAITVLGAAQVKVQAGKAIQPGQRLTVGANGAVRALQTRTVDGMVVSEGAPTIGVALQEPKDGLIWVLVSPQ